MGWWAAIIQWRSWGAWWHWSEGTPLKAPQTEAKQTRRWLIILFWPLLPSSTKPNYSSSKDAQACGRVATSSIVKRARSMNKMKMIIPPTRLRQHQHVLREIEETRPFFVLNKCFRNTGSFRKSLIKIVLHSSLFVWEKKSNDVTRVMNNDVTCALCYSNRLLRCKYFYLQWNQVPDWALNKTIITVY